jgi:hypothetical protein
VAEKWDAIREAVGSHSKVAWTYLGPTNSSLDHVEGTKLVIRFNQEQTAGSFRDRFRGLMEATVQEVLGSKLQVDVVVGPPAQAQAWEAAPQPRPANDTPRPQAAASPSASAPDLPPAPPDDYGAYDDMDLPSPDDEDAGVRGLTGVSLVEKMLGGEVIAEIEDDA